MRFLTCFTVLMVGATTLVSGMLFTQPIEHMVYKAGTTQEIIWIKSDPSEVIQFIELRNGPSENLQLVLTITSDPNIADTNRYSWPIPDNLPAGKDYTLTALTSTGYSYSGRFTIEGLSTDTDSLSAPNSQ
ncbi:hypothetical protein BD560DRAFT_420598 [Blakeslea trispora]|nr:hypothetical protein BD560DRAFT_420598 [Blakeslea trispora]